jgi:hypothetical protein
MNEPYDNTNRGELFRNDKEGNERRPDYRGKLNINGVDYRLSGWVRTPKNGGKKFLSLKAEPVEPAPPRPAPGPPNPSQVKPEPVADDVDDIPF